MTSTHEIHSSQLRNYRQCRMSYRWRHVDNWEPIKKPAPLEDGTVWHKSLEALYQPDTWHQPTATLHAVADAELMLEAQKQKRSYLERCGKYQLDEDEVLDFEERVNTLRSMLTKLCQSLDRNRYRPIAVEQEFGCAILDRDGSQLRCTCSRCLTSIDAWDDPRGLPVTFNCRIDALFEDREGYVYVVDHKSAANLYKSESIVPELEDQLPSYLWCLRKNGYAVTGAILNQFRKAYPKPLRRLEHPQAGRMFSVDRRQLTDYDTAMKVLTMHDSRALKRGLYDEFLEYLKVYGPKYSQQFIIFKTPEQLNVIEHNLVSQAKELINAGPAIYPNPSQINCGQCSFQQPCLTAQGGGNPEADLEAGFVKSEPYYIQRRLKV